ncbi:FAM57A (predicted) [Pycnogonum litorale]
MFLHHVVIIFGILPYCSLRGGKGDFLVGCFYMMEFSLPFVHFRYLLLKLQMANSLLYTINGVFILVTYFIFRILMFPFMYTMYAVQRNLPSITAAVTAVPFLCNVLTFVCFLPQAYWFYVTCRKILSSLLKGNNYEKEEQKTKLL